MANGSHEEMLLGNYTLKRHESRERASRRGDREKENGKKREDKEGEEEKSIANKERQTVRRATHRGEEWKRGIRRAERG